MRKGEGAWEMGWTLVVGGRGRKVVPGTDKSLDKVLEERKFKNRTERNIFQSFL